MRVRPALCALALAAGWAALAPDALPATEKIAEVEALDCSSCHRGRRAKRLNDLGMYYEMTGTVEGYSELTERFARCGTCHRGRPGDSDLTVTGRRYRWFFEDMEGIREWVMSRHPERTSPAADRSTTGQEEESTTCPK